MVMILSPKFLINTDKEILCIYNLGDLPLTSHFFNEERNKACYVACGDIVRIGDHEYTAEHPEDLMLMKNNIETEIQLWRV